MSAHDPSGGAAFPSPGVRWNEDTREYDRDASQEGMTLRDWFAGKFMDRALSLTQNDREWTYQDVAHCAYAMADAMLKARQV